VDIPIGLPAHIGPEGRGPEGMIRPLLGARQSSVFSVPPRNAIYAADFGSACAAALAGSSPPRKVSKQLFMIAPKIKEVDTALRNDGASVGRVYEVHPELAFWRLNGAGDAPASRRPCATPECLLPALCPVMFREWARFL